MSSSLQTFDWWKPPVWDSYLSAVFSEAHFGYVYRRANLDISERRVLAAYPGYGCCFQVDIGGYNRNALIDEIHSLGLPQAVLDDGQTTATLVGGFSGTFYAAVAYFNRANGEIGPISAVSGAISASANRLHIYYLKPWTVMPEVANLIDVLIFIGTTSDPTAMQLQAIDPSPAIGVGVTMKEIINTGDEIDFRSLVAYEIPRGSKFVKTVRGFTLFGGAHGPAGENNDRDQVSMLAPSATKELIEAYGPVKSLGSITGPSWWSGLRISNLPGGPNYALLDELEYYDNATGRVRWKTAELITVSSARSLTNIPMQKGFIGVSEQGFPWQASELSIVDLIQGADVEYAARLGDGYVIATQYETYSLFFGRSPSGTQPRLISDQDGAIAPMIEHDMGVATTSTRGPVNIPGLGVPDWIGERVEDLFLDGLMDSTGFMHHGIVGFDRQRQLVYYGYRKDLYNTDFADAPTDDEKSKVGCDFFLVWSPLANAWSTWTVPEHLANILWMGELLFDDGRPRFCFLVGPPAEARIYAFDDDYFDTFDEAELPSLNVNADDLDNSLVIGKGYRISCIGSPLVFAKRRGSTRSRTPPSRPSKRSISMDRSTSRPTTSCTPASSP
jgi:hypothetical protein